MKAPVGYFSTPMDDHGGTHADANLAKAVAANVVILVAILDEQTSPYVTSDPRWNAAVLAWLDWRMKGDEKAARMLAGANCGLCLYLNWNLRSHGF